MSTTMMDTFKQVASERQAQLWGTYVRLLRSNKPSPDKLYEAAQAVGRTAVGVEQDLRALRRHRELLTRLGEYGSADEVAAARLAALEELNTKGEEIRREADAAIDRLKMALWDADATYDRRHRLVDQLKELAAEHPDLLGESDDTADR